MADIVLNWRGEQYRIPDSRAFEAGAAVEDVVSLAEMQSWGTTPKFFKLAMAMGVLLRFAGAKVSDRDVKSEIDASISKMLASGLEEAVSREIYAASVVQQLTAVLFEGAPNEDDGEPMGETSAS